MESRRMILTNLFAEQQWRCRHREQSYGLGRGKKRERVIKLPIKYFLMASSNVPEHLL